MENKFNKMRIMIIFSTILIILGLILIIVPIFLKFFVFTQICFIYLGNLILMISGSIGGFFFILGIVLIIICLVLLKNDGALYEKYKLGTNVNKMNNKKTETSQKTDYVENIDVNVIPPLANVASLSSQNTSTNIDNNRFENIPVIDTNTQVTQTVDYISPEEMANITTASVNEQHKTVEDDENKQPIDQEINETPEVTEINTITNIKKILGKPKSKMFEHD